MERTKLFSLFRCSIGSQGIFTFMRASIKNPERCASQRCYSKDLKKSEESKEVQELDRRLSLFDHKRFMLPSVNIWHEKAALRKAKRESRDYKKVKSATDLIRYLQDTQKWPLTFSELYYYLKRRKVKQELMSQQYLPQRSAVLKADLAAAHFILNRGGRIKFSGQTEWIGQPGTRVDIPRIYSPGFLVEGINAEGTNLYYEGLENLCNLRHLTWLSLKGLENMNDWCMDWVSREYADTLTHLDISDCKNITYRGLSCFYRFNELKTLVVKGVSESPEFKLACIMLQDIMPFLEIEGIDLSIPKKIDPVEAEDIKELK